MKEYMLFIWTILKVMTFFLIAGIFRYWLHHPEKTEIEIIIQFWWGWLAIALLFASQVIAEKHRIQKIKYDIEN